jgi:hypothetical protein
MYSLYVDATVVLGRYVLKTGFSCVFEVPRGKSRVFTITFLLVHSVSLFCNTATVPPSGLAWP